MESFSLLARIIPFPSTRPDSTIFWYSNWFYHYSVLVRTVFRYSHGFYLYRVVAGILLFSGPHTDSTIFRYSLGKFVVTRTDYTLSRYSPPDSTIFRHSHWFYHFSILVQTVSRYSHVFYLFPVVARILSFSGTDPDITIFRYSSRKFLGTWTDSTFTR